MNQKENSEKLTLQEFKKEIDERKEFKPESLWNNSMVQSALSSMSYEDLEKYKKLGESMYSSINFETSSVTDKNNVPFFLTDAAAYIIEMIKSGMHPSFLDDNEKHILQEVLGKEWYKTYGYVEEDLIEIKTFKKIDI
jgi:hypothetical protein